MSAELHVSTRLDLNPDPEFDLIQAVFYSILTDSRNITETGVVVVTDCLDGKIIAQVFMNIESEYEYNLYLHFG